MKKTKRATKRSVKGPDSRRRAYSKKPILLLCAAALLLLGSTVGSTRAALSYYSESFQARVTMSSIGVTLVENGKAVSSRDYGENGVFTATQGELLTDMLSEGEKFAPGKPYEEALSVKNSGNIDSFVRVVLTRSWKDQAGVKDTTLSPELIDLNLLEGNGWVVDGSATTAERTVIYYTKALKPGEESQALSDTLRIDPEIARKVVRKTEDAGVRYVYEYNGYSFCVDAEVDAVQTHNAKDAMKSAWGIDAAVSEDETSFSLQ